VRCISLNLPRKGPVFSLQYGVLGTVYVIISIGAKDKYTALPELGKKDPVAQFAGCGKQLMKLFDG